MTGAAFSADRRDVLALTAGAMLMPFAAEAATPPTQAVPIGLTTGRGQPFDQGWLFRRGEGSGLEAVSVDDAAWRRVDLPHDWSVEDVPGGEGPDQIGPFDKKAVGHTDTGFTLGGEGWYRKHFRVDKLAPGMRMEILFDGVHSECDVWLNGKPLGTNLYGYTPFAFDLTPALVSSGDNVLAVRVRNLGRNSRWYGGSGIYRSVSVDVMPEGARIARWGIAAWTKRIADGRAQIEVTTSIEVPEPGLTLVNRLRDAEGKVVAEASGPAAAEVRQTLSVRGARLWSPTDPYLYVLETELLRSGRTVDRVVQDFGARIVTMDAQRGLAVNGERMVLNGGCIHHDNGLLGACAYPDADDRRVRLMKARGYNAIRSSHNCASRSLHAACNRHGMLLIDEVYDMWHAPKQPDDFSRHFREHWHQPVTAMVLSGRNSPSVIMWSVGNEISERSTPEGVEWSWKLSNLARRLDPTRPVTAALNGVLGPLMHVSEKTARPGTAGKPDNASTAFFDVVGYNYRMTEIEDDHRAHPDRVIYASETYPADAYDYADMARRLPYMLGEFVWTAMDYIGEAGIGATANVSGGGAAVFFPGWPWVISWCGDLDLIGDQKAPSHYRDVVWGVSKLEMLVTRPGTAKGKQKLSAWGWPDEMSSWTWPGAEGKSLTVRLYAAADRVEVLLNGAKVGESALTAADKLRAEFEVPYAAGRIEAVAYKEGREIARRSLETAGAPARLRLRPEALKVGSGRDRIAYVPIDVLDRQGRLVPDDSRKIAVTVSGPAELAAFGSGSPVATGSFQAPEAQSFRGRAMVILRGKGRKGKVRVTALTEGLESASATIELV